LGAIERLHLALLIDAQNRRLLRAGSLLFLRPLRRASSRMRGLCHRPARFATAALNLQPKLGTRSSNRLCWSGLRTWRAGGGTKSLTRIAGKRVECRQRGDCAGGEGNSVLSRRRRLAREVRRTMDSDLRHIVSSLAAIGRLRARLGRVCPDGKASDLTGVNSSFA
jgi:hypothetical protein